MVTSLDADAIPVLVSQFTSHDSIGALIGKNHAERQWRVVFDRDQDPVHIKLTVHEHKMHHHEVGVETNNGHKLLGDGLSPLVDMNQDFSYSWPFRAKIFGLNVANYFEYRPAYHLDVWHPATITKQHNSRSFEVDALEPDGRGGSRSVYHKSVDGASLREAASKLPIPVQHNSLRLFVPLKDPIHAQLVLEDGGMVKHHFGRFSPAPSSAKRELNLKVSKDRTSVTANVGHAELAHFVSGHVWIIKTDAERSSRSWTFLLGPFAEHRVEASKRYRTGSVISLSVDGETFVEASAAEIGCHGGTWKCIFYFVGERVMNIEVYTTNTDGEATDNTSIVTQRRPYRHKCCVEIPNPADFRTAQFSIDDWAFPEHELAHKQHEDPHVVMSPDAFWTTYKILIPYKVDVEAPTNVSVITSGFTDALKALFADFVSCTSCCSKQDPADKLEIAAPDRPQVAHHKTGSRHVDHEELEEELAFDQLSGKMGFQGQMGSQDPDAL